MDNSLNTARQERAARTALTKAIETKVGRMQLSGLLDLARTLNVALPAEANRIKRRLKPHTSPSARESRVLKGSGIGAIVSPEQGHKILDAVTVDDDSADWLESQFVGAGELAKRLNVSRGTLDNWRKARKIVALQKGLRNFVYPLRQFERRRPVAGLDLIAPHFPSPEEAWEWLIAPNRMTFGKPPIEALRDGEVPVVTRAAAGALDYA